MRRDSRWMRSLERLDRLLTGEPRRACRSLLVLFVLAFLIDPNPFRSVLAPSQGVLFRAWARDIATIAEPRGGEAYVLPLPSQDAIALLREHGIAQYRMSPGLRAQRVVGARIGDGAVPILADRNAAYLLLYKFELVPADCRILAVRGAVRLAHCG